MGEKIINLISAIGLGLVEIVIIAIIAVGYSILTNYVKQKAGAENATVQCVEPNNQKFETENRIQDNGEKEGTTKVESQGRGIDGTYGINEVDSERIIEKQCEVHQNNVIKNVEGKELKWAIEQERKENRKFVFYSEPIEYIGKCNFLHGDYCEKYDYTPADCSQGCTWRERRLPDYRIKYNEEIRSDDIQNEKRLSLFGEFYYDYEAFNKENYEDIQDYIQYMVEHYK